MDHATRAGHGRMEGHNVMSKNTTATVWTLLGSQTLLTEASDAVIRSATDSEAVNRQTSAILTPMRAALKDVKADDGAGFAKVLSETVAKVGNQRELDRIA